MGTQYTVFEKDGFEVCLNERSSEFGLMLKASDERSTAHVRAWPPGAGTMVRTAAAFTSKDLTPEEVIAMAVAMIRVAANWSEDAAKARDAAAERVMNIDLW